MLEGSLLVCASAGMAEREHPSECAQHRRFAPAIGAATALRPSPILRHSTDQRREQVCRQQRNQGTFHSPKNTLKVPPLRLRTVLCQESGTTYPLTPRKLVAPLDVGQSTVSHHLKILGDVRFILVDRVGTTSWWRINEACLDCFPTADELVMGRLPADAAIGIIRGCAAFGGFAASLLVIRVAKRTQPAKLMLWGYRSFAMVGCAVHQCAVGHRGDLAVPRTVRALRTAERHISNRYTGDSPTPLSPRGPRTPERHRVRNRCNRSGRRHHRCRTARRPRPDHPAFRCSSRRLPPMRHRHLLAHHPTITSCSGGLSNLT